MTQNIPNEIVSKQASDCQRVWYMQYKIDAFKTHYV